VNPAAVMAEIAATLKELPGIKSATGHPVKSVGSTPSAVVGYGEIEYTITSTAGADRLTIPVWVVLGDVVAAATAEKYGAFAGREGPRSVLGALETKDDWTTCDYVHVRGGSIEAVSVADKDMLAVTFELDVVASNDD
jgi:hypothetical protein